MTFRKITLLVLALFAWNQLLAEPWLNPGDMQLRHDLEVLSDAGVIKTPVTTWPISLASLVNDFEQFESRASLSEREELAYIRLIKRVQKEKLIGQLNTSVHGAASRVKPLIRGFEDVARSDLEVGGSFSYLSDRFALKISPTLVDNAEDGKNVTFDNSYLSTVLGNTVITAGAIDRWWGPGWQGSLIYGNNSRPIPGLSVQRNFTTPFQSRWLSWLGHWNYSITAGQLESNRIVPSPYHLGMRVSFKPKQNLEIGLTRTAQWGGEGRPTDSDSFLDLLLGQDNIGSNGLTRDNEPGNQMAGFDVRWKQNLLPFDLTLYAQGIGEDEAGGFPSRYLGQVGFKHSRRVFNSDMIMWLEYSDTACNFLDSIPRLNCAYNNGIYQSGYRYYGRSIGHSIDGDGRNLTLGGVINLPSNNYYAFQLQKLNINRAPDANHGISTVPSDGHQIEFSYHSYHPWGKMRMHIGHQSFDVGLSDSQGLLFGIEFNRELK